MSDCIFCRIIAKEILSSAVYEDEFVYAFRDINPEAPSHVLVVPRRHIPSLAEAQDSDVDWLGKLMLGCAKAASAEGVSADGYRVVINTNRAAGQVVFHIHAHMLGGREFGWPPG